MKKKIILIFWAAFLVSEKIVAQNTILENDTTLNVKIIMIDKDLVFPKLKNPKMFCEQIKKTWSDYLRRNARAITEYNFNNHSNNYSSITFDILRNGTVSDIRNKDWYSKLDSLCNNVFGDMLMKSIWFASYKKSTKSRKYLNTTVKVYFTIASGGLQQINFVDLKSAQSFYKCF